MDTGYTRGLLIYAQQNIDTSRWFKVKIWERGPTVPEQITGHSDGLNMLAWQVITILTQEALNNIASRFIVIDRIYNFLFSRDKYQNQKSK